MTRKDILNSATITAAKNMRIENKVGSLEPGKYADLLILSANPMDDLSNLKQAEQIMKVGAFI